MKRGIPLLIILLFCSVHAFSQTDQDSLRAKREREQDSIRSVRLSEQQSVRNNNYVASPAAADEGFKACIYVTLGPSIPTGEFAATDVRNDESGFAKGGAVFDIGFTYKIDMNFGMCVVIRGMSNEFDADKYRMEYNNAQNAITINTYKSDPWSTAALMVGGYATSAIDSRNKFFVEGKLMLGLVSVTCPQQEVSFTANNITQYGLLNEVDGSGFGVCIMGGLRYNASRRIALKMDLDYFGAKANFKEQNYVNGTTPAFSQKVGSINFSVGVGYMFK